MKKILLLIMCIPAILSAQTGNGVTVGNLVVNPAGGTVTFGVGWTQAEMPEGNNKVWVFVDYNDNGVMQRLLVSGATVTSGTAIKLDDNDKGAWVINSQGAADFSATVTLSFTSPSAVFGACAYAINYPPVGEYVTASSITFTGTPPFDLVLSSGSQIPVQTGYELVGSETLVSFTDKTGAPGTFACVPPAAPTVAEATFCFGFPGQLQASAPDGGTVKWYDAPTEGNLLYTGNVLLLLTPLYSTSAQYYAQSVLAGQCVSLTRTQAIYTVNNCAMGNDCPNYTAGSVSGTSSLSACSVFYPGQIGVAGYRAACGTYSAGQIGRSQ